MIPKRMPQLASASLRHAFTEKCPEGMRKTRASYLMIRGCGIEVICQATVSIRKIVIRNSRKIVVQGMVAQPDRSPQFRPWRPGGVDRVSQLRLASHWLAITLVRVRA